MTILARYTTIPPFPATDLDPSALRATNISGYVVDYTGSLPSSDEVLAFGINAITVAPDYLDGFELNYISSSSVHIGADPYLLYAVCSDSTNTLFLNTLGTTMSNSGSWELGSFNDQGTCSCTTGTAAVIGTSTKFLTDFGVRAGSGTISSSSTAVTGTNTIFMTGKGKLAVGDLIGNSSKGYFQIIAIASDTGITLASAPGSAFSNEAYNIIENPVILIGTLANGYQVKAIADDTHLTLTVNNAGTTQTNQNYHIGVATLIKCTQPLSNQMLCYAWIIGQLNQPTGSMFLSTQRTKPYLRQMPVIGPGPYFYRRVGTLPMDGSGFIAFSQSGRGRTKSYTYETAKSGNSTRVLATGTATGWTPVVCAGVIPPTAESVNMILTVTNLLNGIAYVRQRGIGSSTVTRNNFVICTATGGANSYIPGMIVDGAGAMDYGNSSATLNTFIDIVGWNEEY